MTSTEPSLDFKSTLLKDELCAVVADLGFDSMTEIQAAAIPVLLTGKDLIGQSQTGSGKTAAFVLPILHNLDMSRQQGAQVQALIICPTRELVAQVVADFRKLGRLLPGLQVLSLIGGQPGREQAESLKAGVHILVGTPGRILDHGTKGRIDVSELKTLVLDEADKMLEMGFEEEIKAVIDSLPAKRQTVLFSATFPNEIEALSRRYQKNPVRIKIEVSAELKRNIEQYVYESPTADRVKTLMRVLQQHPAQSVVVFCNQKATIAEVTDLLAQSQVSCSALHGDLEQRERDRVMSMFKNGSTRILVATDVAARGLDIDNLELVVNLDLPTQTETYIHRIGRTGRAGRSGVAVTIMPPNQELKIQELEKMSGVPMLRKPLGFKNQFGLGAAYQGSAMQTLSISGGREHKLRPGDILGSLTAQKDNLPALKSADIGKIEIHDRFSYVAVASAVSQLALTKLRDGRIKGSKFQVRFIK